MSLRRPVGEGHDHYLQFPIPMRGNELRDGGLNGFRDRRFPIPMRGNERAVQEITPQGRKVSDPHEG